MTLACEGSATPTPITRRWIDPSVAVPCAKRACERGPSLCGLENGRFSPCERLRVGPSMWGMNADGAQHQLSHRQILIAFSGLLLGMLLGALDQTVVATALPTIVRDLGGLSQLSWGVTAYLLAYTTSIISEAHT